jgi:hypothetical protein
LVYDPTIHESAVNYQNETIELRINYRLAPNSNLKVIQDLQKGLLASGHSAEWRLSDELGYRNRRRLYNQYIGDENVPRGVWPGTDRITNSTTSGGGFFIAGDLGAFL